MAALSPNPRANQTGSHWPDTSASFPHVTRKSTLEAIAPVAPPLQIPNESQIVPPSLYPSTSVFERPTISRLLGQEGSPRIPPIFLGLQARLLQRRLENTEEKLLELSHRAPTLRERKAQFIGSSILNIKGYWTDGAELRPTNLRERLTARALESLAEMRRTRIARAHNTALLYSPRGNDGFSPDFTGPGDRATFPEKYENWRKSRKYGKDVSQAERRDQAFAWVISPRVAKINRLTQRRNRLLLKQHAVENIRQGRPADWNESPEAPDRVYQFGNPDARGKVAVGRIFDRPRDIVNLATDPVTKDSTREVLVNGQNGSSRYLKGNRLYAWRVEDDGSVSFNRPLNFKAESSVLQQPIFIGQPWLGGTPVESVAIRTGNMGRDVANDTHIPAIAENPFADARRIAEHIDLM